MDISETDDVDQRFLSAIHEVEEAIKIENTWILKEKIEAARKIKDEMTDAGMIADADHQLREYASKLSDLEEQENA
ncbi:MAG TPA: hypothetical protein VI981_04645 [Candidatus Paceibacterota bacterium]